MKKEHRHEAIEVAKINNHPEIVMLLLNKFKDKIPFHWKKGAINWGIINGHIKMAQLLLDYNIDFSTKVMSAIKSSICNGHIRIIKLLQHKMDIFLSLFT